MFAKVFGQIFDSSIAEDYNCRRMFMDLLVLANEVGEVDMTHEAIARRTNVPIDEVRRYIEELEHPDPASRSQLEQGKRLIRLHDNVEWGWLIVNYKHYRNLRDKEALRNYFRNQQREYRAKKKRDVKDTSLTDQDIFDKAGQSLTSASASSSVLKEGVRGRFKEWMDFRKGNGRKIKRWDALFDSQAKWLSKFSESDQLEILEQSIRNGWQGLFPLKRNPVPTASRVAPTWSDRKALKEAISEVQEKKNALFKIKRSENREFTPEEQQAYDTLSKRLEELKAL